jgi:hypothetical protein
MPTQTRGILIALRAAPCLVRAAIVGRVPDGFGWEKWPGDGARADAAVSARADVLAQVLGQDSLSGSMGKRAGAYTRHWRLRSLRRCRVSHQVSTIVTGRVACRTCPVSGTSLT